MSSSELLSSELSMSFAGPAAAAAAVFIIEVLLPSNDFTRANRASNAS